MPWLYSPDSDDLLNIMVMSSMNNLVLHRGGYALCKHRELPSPTSASPFDSSMAPNSMNLFSYSTAAQKGAGQ